MTSFILSKGSFYDTALFNNVGNKHASLNIINIILLICIEVSRAVFGIMALIGKEILVRFKLPDKIFLPIYLTISFPTDLILSF